MPTLVLNDTVVEVLETALRENVVVYSQAPLPQEPFLTEEISAPFDILWPEGEIVVPIETTNYVPESHDVTDAE